MATSVPFLPDPKQVGMRDAQVSRVFRQRIRDGPGVSGATVDLEAILDAVNELGAILAEDSAAEEWLLAPRVIHMSFLIRSAPDTISRLFLKKSQSRL